MCGIITIIGPHPVLPQLLEAMERLEYRGYDSTGVAVFAPPSPSHPSATESDPIQCYRTVGRLSALRAKVPDIQGTVGMGHTRWATHGEPCESNAHPQRSQRVAVVHNGIIENFSELKKMLLASGYEFRSETDTEVLAHLFDLGYAQYEDLHATMVWVLPQLKGEFALCAMFHGHPDAVVAARQGSSPLAVGFGAYTEDDRVTMISASSDALGLLDLADEIAYVPGGSWGILTLKAVEFYDFSGKPIELKRQHNPFQTFNVTKGPYEHFMRKEMTEQTTIVQTVRQDTIAFQAHWQRLQPQHVTFLGCGTAFYAGWVAKYFWEKLVKLPTTLALASEFYASQSPMIPGVTFAISQSGETVDTLKAAEYAKQLGQHLVGIVNVPQSSLARQAHRVFYTQAGPEIGVASTKAFTAQIWTLLLLAMSLSEPNDALIDLQQCLAALPTLMEKVFLLGPYIQDLASYLSHHPSVLYLGRGINHPLALEGALKMKELSYIHAEGLSAGELKHGSIALVEASLPLILLIPSDEYFDKTLSNLHEILARKGSVIAITDEKGAPYFQGAPLRALITLPWSGSSLLQPFLNTLVLQLLAYDTARYLGRPVDNPRNLAKSVTVH